MHGCWDDKGGCIFSGSGHRLFFGVILDQKLWFFFNHGMNFNWQFISCILSVVHDSLKYSHSVK